MSLLGAGPIRVIVADGSAFVRQSLRREIASVTGVEVVAVTGEPTILVSRLIALRPDVLVLDDRLLPPGESPLRGTLQSMDGLAVLLLASGAPGARAGLPASQGSVPRPMEDLEDRIAPFAETVVRALQALRARHKECAPRGGPVAARASTPSPHRPRVIAIGASTGGTDALRRVLDCLPPTIPGIVIVQHMPERFTGSFAATLDRTAPIDVHLAADGEAIQAGLALVAPGNRHLEVVAGRSGLAVRVFDAPPVNRHRPSVDVLFRSVAGHVGADALGVLLTGMGADGAEGLLEMLRAGARTIAQDEASSVVFGMPRAAIERGAADQVLGLDAIAPEIARQAGLGPLRPQQSPSPNALVGTQKETERWRRS